MHGIYAGDTDKLSIKSCFPSIYELEKEHGSVVKGMLFAKKPKILPFSNDDAGQFMSKMAKESIYSFKGTYTCKLNLIGGMQTLTDTLLEQIKNSGNVEIIQGFGTALELNPKNTGNNSRLEINNEKIIDFDYMFSTIPARNLAEILSTSISKNNTNTKSPTLYE